MKLNLTWLTLLDRYERKARLLPALLSCWVCVPGVVSLSSTILGWIPSLPVGGVFAAMGAVGLAYCASVAGRLYECKLWPRWPDDFPTHRWLHPDDNSCSQQQKQLWYAAVKQLVGLDIAQAATQGDKENIDWVITDAVRELRHQFRLTKVSGLLATHNEDYGFARNLAGLSLFWFPASCISILVAWAVYFATGDGLIWGIVASFVLLLALSLLCILPGYVRQRAERYADSFFGTLTALSQQSKK